LLSVLNLALCCNFVMIIASRSSSNNARVALTTHRPPTPTARSKHGDGTGLKGALNFEEYEVGICFILI
jgi:hypothetical protein